MTHLNFRLIVIPPPDAEPDLNLLRRYVEDCDLSVVTILRLELKNTKKNDQPQIFEYILDVQADNPNIISNRNKVPVFQELCLRWHGVTSAIVGERPLLQGFHDECYAHKRVSSHNNLSVPRVSFGVQVRFGEFIEYASIECLTANFSHDIKEMEILISQENKVSFLDFSKEIQRQLSVSYRSIRNIFVSLSNVNFDLYLDLLNCPLFYKSVTERSPFTNKIVSSSYNRILPFGIDKTIVGKSNLLHLHFTSANEAFEILTCLRNRCDKIPINFVAMTSRPDMPPIAPAFDFLHFGCSYMWTAIINRSYTFLKQALNVERQTEKLQDYCAQNAFCLEKAMSDLLFVIDSGRLVNYWHVLDTLYSTYTQKYKSASPEDLAIPSKCPLIRRVTFTPTRTLLWPADLMCENRVLRNFDSEYFLRVTFRDDDFSTLNIRMYEMDVFLEVVQKPMNYGLLIGSRFYEMLAWSSSQLKEHGISMYAIDSEGRSASDIRTWTEIDPRTTMNIPKCLARIRQCFSQTEDTVHVPLDNIHVRFEKDIEHGYNPITTKPYTFSDGVGKMSTGLAKKVVRSLSHASSCSAFQIRYGGCKGMLVVDPTLKNSDIVFRESMRKFHCRGSGHTKLEIASKSAPITMRLNRPLISILHDLKVEPRIFLRLQETMLQNLTDMLMDEEKASLYLNARTPFSVFKFQDLSKSGVSLIMEPFFRNLLLALHRYYIDIIKSKANIDLDPDVARNMFGVLDETGKLEYGQVFVQYSRDVSLGVTTPDDTNILKGTVMVTKFPCIHPADVRKFTAVDVPELHHIIDCIVFPQKGPRPHTDEMAGSDLDGDQYAVIWMPELIFQGENAKPPHYPKPSLSEFKNISDFLVRSKPDEVTEFLVHYIKNDQLGAIASAHLALADQLSIHNPLCLSISQKHAIAVDFAKTGCTVSLEKDERPKKYPDFMEKIWQKKYKSKKSLGKMYRVSKDFESENRISVLKYRNVQVDPALVVSGWETFEECASASRDEYNNTIKTVLQTYGIGHETEAFGGAFIKLHSRFRERRDRAEIVNLVHTWLKELVDKTRRQFFSHPVSGSVDEITQDLQRKASAWYIVTYREKEAEFLSFPWVVSEILANIRILKLSSVQPLIRVSLVESIEDLILKNDEAGLLRPLPADGISLLSQLNFLCNHRIFDRAVRVLTQWAEDERIITTVRKVGKFLYYNTFVKLIIHVARREGYIANDEGKQENNPSSAALCLSFFRYCMRLRFLKKREVESVLPFPVYNDRILARMAIITFHSIAVTGTFPTLCNQEYMHPVPELVEMRPVTIESSVLGRYPVGKAKLRNAEDILKKHSEVEWISMRERTQKRKIIVLAGGTMFAIRRLKELLFKSTETLEIFFRTG